MAGEWQSRGDAAKQRRFFWPVAEEKLFARITNIAHIFHAKNLDKRFRFFSLPGAVEDIFSAPLPSYGSIFLGG